MTDSKLKKEHDVHLKALARQHKPQKVPTLRSKKDVEQANARLKDIGTALKAIETDKKEIIKPLRGVLDKLYARYRILTGALKTEEAGLKTQLNRYLERQQAKRVKAAVKKAEDRGLDADFAATQAALTRPDVPDLKVRNVWSYEVDDLSKVPVVVNDVMIMELKHGAILKVIRDADGDIEIPGVTVLQKQEVTR